MNFWYSVTHKKNKTDMKSHYVPQVYLKYFRIPKDIGKKTPRIRWLRKIVPREEKLRSVSSVGYEQGLYAFDLTIQDKFEIIFQEYEQEYTPLIREVKAGKLTENRKVELIKLISVFHFRMKHYKSKGINSFSPSNFGELVEKAAEEFRFQYFVPPKNKDEYIKTMQTLVDLDQPGEIKNGILYDLLSKMEIESKKFIIRNLNVSIIRSDQLTNDNQLIASDYFGNFWLWNDFIVGISVPITPTELLFVYDHRFIKIKKLEMSTQDVKRFVSITFDFCFEYLFFSLKLPHGTYERMIKGNKLRKKLNRSRGVIIDDLAIIDPIFLDKLDLSFKPDFFDLRNSIIGFKYRMKRIIHKLLPSRLF